MGKHKGNAFELLIYKELRVHGHCKRTIGSGSSDEAGDITFNHYSIECKHLKQVRWVMLTKFWNKLKDEVTSWNKISKHKTEPVIIFRQNREPIMVMCLMKCEGKIVRSITSYNIWKQLIIK